MLQLYKLFGSIEILGNPVSLIENLGTGVADLFYEPFLALVKGKDSKRGLKFGQSIAYGVKSLLSHSVSGISNTIHIFISTIMKALASLTADKLYLQSRQKMKNRTFKTYGQGFVLGLKYFLKTCGEALIGTLKSPCIDFKTSGIWGLVRGTYSVNLFVSSLYSFICRHW